jgi:hypothetical protein
VYFITFVFSFQPLMMALIFGTTLEQLYWWKVTPPSLFFFFFFFSRAASPHAHARQRFIYKVFFNKEIDIESKLASDDGRSSTPTPGSGSKQSTFSPRAPCESPPHSSFSFKSGLQFGLCQRVLTLLYPSIARVPAITTSQCLAVFTQYSK